MIVTRQLIVVAALLSWLAPRALSQGNAAEMLESFTPKACAEYAKTEIPPADLPSAKDRETLGSCNSENLYFGFDHPADPTAARKCAYMERVAHKGPPEVIFGSAGLLSMIYANGKGADRNLDLALKFACETGWAVAEVYGRVDHLEKLKAKHWTGDNFSLCDDATSGFMGGWCAHLQERFDKAERERELKRLVGHWTPVERAAFAELQRAAEAFFEASTENEVDLSGTLRAALQIEHYAALEKEFLLALQRFERGQLPHASRAELAQADAVLNSTYSVIQARGDGESRGTVTVEGIKTAERIWLPYREAWVKFGKVKYPAVTAESWRSWLTRNRNKMLRDLE